MFLRAYLAVEKFLKGLPFVRNIPGFNTLPPDLNPKYLRFYKLCNLVNTLGMFVHASWISLFFYLKVYPLVYINILSVAIYICNIIINRRGYHFTSSVIMVSEIIVHQLIAVPYLGWDGGFQYYILVIALFPFMMPKGKWLLKGTMLAASVSIFVALEIICKGKPPIVSIPHAWIIFFGISNAAFSCISLTICGGYFSVTMEETEAELENKTEELIESEKKATLGKLATEMAHEIQNPMNFVNNFSEINAELLRELKAELEKTHSGEEVNQLLRIISENSERINLNGKRVSKIVHELQERARKL